MRIFAVILASLVASVAHAGGLINVGDNCQIGMPPHAAHAPESSWFQQFKPVYEANKSTWDKAIDKFPWKGPRPAFDSCTGFKLFMGICAFESNLNEKVGKGSDAIPSPGLCQIQVRNCEGFGISGSQLNNGAMNIKCAAQLATKQMKTDSCISQGASLRKGGHRCLTIWSVMLPKGTMVGKNNVGHQEEIMQYMQNNDGGSKQ